MKIPLPLLFLLTLSPLIHSKTAEEWKDRVIYEIMTDRFYRPDNPTYVCQDLNSYCGGTFKGIEANLDYLQGLGVNAIWISPVQPNTPGGYHGYWPTNFYEINPHFGTDSDFRDLIRACHERDIWVMIDAVVNHVGYVQSLDDIQKTEQNDYSGVVPFNKPEYFHDYEWECKDAEAKGHNDDYTLESCWLFWLPDLKQENPDTRKLLLDWVQWFVNTYDIDGLRLDALRHVPKDFWKELSLASGVYTLGEAWHPDVSYNADYQRYVDALLNFPLQERLNDCFAHNKPMTILSEYFKEAYATFPDITVLANFLDCHDKERFLTTSANPHTFKSAITFILSAVGIPTIYYGDEQSFVGGKDVEQNRETLWGNMDRNAEMYQFIKKVLEFRKKSGFHKFEQVERHADESIYAFTRGVVFFVFTNSEQVQSRFMENHNYPENTRLCNVFDHDDCVMVKDGKFEVRIASKDTKILMPLLKEDSEKKEVNIWDSIAECSKFAVMDNNSF